MERELTSVLIFGLQANVSIWTQHYKGHKISMYNIQTTLKLTEMDYTVSYITLQKSMQFKLHLWAVYPNIVFHLQPVKFSFLHFSVITLNFEVYTLLLYVTASLSW